MRDLKQVYERNKKIDKKMSFIGILLFCFLFLTACSTSRFDMEVSELQEIETIPEIEVNEKTADFDDIAETKTSLTVTNLSSSIQTGKKRITPTPKPKPKSKKKVAPTPTPKPTVNNKVTLTPETIKPPKITSGSLEEYADEILNLIITDDMDDVLKVKAVHDYIVLNTAYDSRNPDSRTFPEESYMEEGVLYQGKAVCQGYALAFQLFMKQLDIEVKFVTGEDLKTGVGHAWNMVKLGKHWYHIDVTWDDPVPDQEGSVQYQYFLVTDKVMAKDHSWDRRDFPECDSTKYQYYIYNDYIVQNIENYDEKFMELYQKGERTITVLYPENGKPDMNFLLEQKALRKEENGKLVVSYRYYEPWRLGDYTVFTVKLGS